MNPNQASWEIDQIDREWLKMSAQSSAYGFEINELKTIMYAQWDRRPYQVLVCMAEVSIYDELKLKSMVLVQSSAFLALFSVTSRCW